MPDPYSPNHILGNLLKNYTSKSCLNTVYELRKLILAVENEVRKFSNKSLSRSLVDITSYDPDIVVGMPGSNV